MVDRIYIPRSDVLDLITETYESGGFTDYSDYSSLWDSVDDMPAAEVQSIITTEDLATATEQFICKNCGIRIEDFSKIVLEEDNDGYVDKLYYEYRFKFCPECGAKIINGGADDDT